MVRSGGFLELLRVLEFGRLEVDTLKKRDSLMKEVDYGQASQKKRSFTAWAGRERGSS